jgi:hypothetical protein
MRSDSSTRVACNRSDAMRLQRLATLATEEFYRLTNDVYGLQDETGPNGEKFSARELRNVARALTNLERVLAWDTPERLNRLCTDLRTFFEDKQTRFLPHDDEYLAALGELQTSIEAVEKLAQADGLREPTTDQSLRAEALRLVDSFEPAVGESPRTEASPLVDTFKPAAAAKIALGQALTRNVDTQPL